MHLPPAVRLRIVSYCPDLWLGSNEAGVLAAAAIGGAELVELGAAAFHRVSLRDQPDGLLGVGVQFPTTMDQLDPPDEPLLMVVQEVEKPRNLGTILRTADAASVAAIIVSDPATTR
jgi:RNA methyltransferase, TrmH family